MRFQRIPFFVFSSSCLFHVDFLHCAVTHLYDVDTALRMVDAFTANGVALHFRCVGSITVWQFDACWHTFLHPRELFPAVSRLVFFYRALWNIKRAIFVNEVRNDIVNIEWFLYQ